VSQTSQDACRIDDEHLLSSLLVWSGHPPPISYSRHTKPSKYILWFNLKILDSIWQYLNGGMGKGNEYLNGVEAHQNACLNWCAYQFAYLIILTMPIKLSDHSNFPTIQLSSYPTCPTITTFELFNHSDFPTVQPLWPIQPFQLSNHCNIQTFQPLQLPDQSDFSPIPPFWLSDHPTFPTVKPFRLSDFPTFQPFQPSTHSNCSTIRTFTLSNYSDCATIPPSDHSNNSD
jgi:hypothetical protein